jgi:LemA protein
METIQAGKYDKNLKTKGAGCLGWTMVLGLVFILIIVLGIMAYSYYNGMVTREEKVMSQWSQVENLYQRRADLIKNIVATVKGYATHEQTTLTAVTEARSKATSVNITAENLNDETLQKFEAAQDELKSAFSRLMVVMEQYPDLKANAGFMKLMDQLDATENGITAERALFNETARDYNTAIRKFPRNLFASMFGFESKAYFKADEGAENAPDIDFK